MLETFLSGASFTDMLARMSSQLDAAEQDRALAAQIAEDRETLLALHETVEATRGQTNLLRQETGVQKQKLDRGWRSCKQAAGAAARSSRRQAEAALAAQQRRSTRSSPRTRRSSSARSPRPPPPSASSRTRSTGSSREQYNHGQHPVAVQRHAALADAGHDQRRLRLLELRRRTPPGNGCEHFHNGIDIVARVRHRRSAPRATGSGRVHRLELRRRRRPGLDRDRRPLPEPADLVRAHAAAATRCGRARSVKKGQVIGYEGNTGQLDRRAPPLDGRATTATS